MKKIIKYPLKTEDALKYFIDNLSKTNILSEKVMELVDFRKGNFFTLLPEEIDPSHIYKFKIGGILPHFLDTESNLTRTNSHNSTIRSIDEEISRIIVNMMSTNMISSCVFDDVIRRPTDKDFKNLLRNYGIFYQNEVYYLIQKPNSISSVITDCLNESKSFWHSLCILSNTTICHSENRKLTLTLIENICTEAELILIGAYDGEGYVLWEKTAGFIDDNVPLKK